ncbi:MAG TPA: type I-E CRISPR-associated protein Cse1/CasA [Thermoclostridium sp.]|nr:type I-E CRISPR-associated protein Cse1/CasA [Thermoclostridium sp.]
MNRFNLLEEPWILVMTDEKSTSKQVSLVQLFQNAHKYKQLAGEMQMQNFAILRLLLAVLHTVFSRFNFEGEPYPYLTLDERFRQEAELDEDDLEDHKDNLMSTWEALWQAKAFPEIVVDYLHHWEERFYLFDEKHPFYQVTNEELFKRPIKAGRGSSPTQVYPKTLNRVISESGNKIALFSPRYGVDENKNRVSETELARWLILYQGLVGTGDKARYEDFEGTNSKGWIYDIGGIALRGDNLFETLLLNLALLHPEEEYQTSMQRPSWEQSGDEIISRLLLGYPVDNLAELYTNWSRAIYIDPEGQLEDGFTISTVKLPEINHQDQFVELMTLWRFRTQGPNKDFRTPQKHQMNTSFWQSFGTIFLSKDANDKRPGIIDWFYEIEKITNQTNAVIESYGMESDGNATSWLPVEECFDTLDINEHVLADMQDDGWVVRINGEVEKTKEIIEKTFGKFVNEVKDIRNIDDKGFANKFILQAYYEVDLPFRLWLNSLEVNQDKEECVQEWRLKLRAIIRKQADFLVQSAGHRDYKGIHKKGKSFKNIATAYNDFNYFLNKNLGSINNQKGE